MWTYSCVKSQVQMRADAEPEPRSTRIGTYFVSIFSWAADSSNVSSRPPRHTATPPIQMLVLPGSNEAPDRPAAARIRPQLGSAPAKAVFTKGEFAIVRAT